MFEKPNKLPFIERIITHELSLCRLKRSDDAIASYARLLQKEPLAQLQTQAHKTYGEALERNEEVTRAVYQGIGRPLPDYVKVALSESKSNLPVCTVTKAKKLERCILKVKKKGAAVNPYAVCMVSVGCRKGGSKMSESGDTIKITGTCEDSPDKCVYTLKRVGTSLKIMGTKQLSRAIEGQGLKEAVPAKVLTAIKNPVEVKV